MIVISVRIRWKYVVFVIYGIFVNVFISINYDGWFYRGFIEVKVMKWVYEERKEMCKKWVIC